MKHLFLLLLLAGLLAACSNETHDSGNNKADTETDPATDQSAEAKDPTQAEAGRELQSVVDYYLQIPVQYYSTAAELTDAQKRKKISDKNLANGWLELGNRVEGERAVQAADPLVVLFVSEAGEPVVALSWLMPANQNLTFFTLQNGKLRPNPEVFPAYSRAEVLQLIEEAVASGKMSGKVDFANTYYNLPKKGLDTHLIADDAGQEVILATITYDYATGKFVRK